MQPRSRTPLAPRTTLGVGGAARYFWEAGSDDELLEAVAWARRRGVPIRVLGGGSNVVIADGGFDGLVIQVAIKGIAQDSPRDAALRVAAGENWHAFVMQQVALGRQGVECLAGIPGLVGATPIQNVGAYGQEVSEVITRVVALDVESERFRTFSSDELEFGYRDSWFKRAGAGRFIVTRVDFNLRPGGSPSLRYEDLRREAAELRAQRSIEQLALSDVTSIVLDLRKQKSMVLDLGDDNRRSCGSFFVNPCVSREVFQAIASSVPERVPHYVQPDGTLKLPAAWLIERAGLSRGTRRGSVGLSTKHTLAVVCHEGARADDVLRFAHEIRQRVRKRFDVLLTPEPVFWGFGGLKQGLPECPADNPTPSAASG